MPSPAQVHPPPPLSSYQRLKITLLLQAVRKKMRLECKCHGVSGSCTVRTCWQTMAPFGATARWLKTRYDGATEVSVLPNGAGLVPRHGDHKKPRKKDLVYLEPSPDYCDADSSSGRSWSGGTHSVCER